MGGKGRRKKIKDKGSKNVKNEKFRLRHTLKFA